jgi:hypothetical protein
MKATLPGFAALQLSCFNATPFAVTREAKCLQDMTIGEQRDGCRINGVLEVKKEIPIKTHLDN